MQSHSDGTKTYSPERVCLVNLGTSGPLKPDKIWQADEVWTTLLKKTIEHCPKHNRKCNGFNGLNGNCIVLMETIMLSTCM